MRTATAGLRQNAWFWAAVAVVGVLAWQALTVRANYGGNWTGLFCTGQTAPSPQTSSVAPTATVRRMAMTASTTGCSLAIRFCGPFSRPAPDPFAPDSRAADGLDARGRPPGLIDGAYILVMAGFVFGGVCWLASILVRQGRHAVFGLLFLAVPATIVSIDRMTADLAVGALTAGVAYRLISGRDKGPVCG